MERGSDDYHADETSRNTDSDSDDAADVDRDRVDAGEGECASAPETVTVNIPVVAIDDVADTVTIEAGRAAGAGVAVTETDTGCWVTGEVDRALLTDGTYTLAEPVAGRDAGRPQFRVTPTADARTHMTIPDADVLEDAREDAGVTKATDRVYGDAHTDTDSGTGTGSAGSEGGRGSGNGDGDETVGPAGEMLVPVVVRITGVPDWRRDIAVTFRDENRDVIASLVGGQAPRDSDTIALETVTMPETGFVTATIQIHAERDITDVIGRVELMSVGTAAELVERSGDVLDEPTVYIDGDPVIGREHNTPSGTDDANGDGTTGETVTTPGMAAAPTTTEPADLTGVTPGETPDWMRAGAAAGERHIDLSVTGDVTVDTHTDDT